MSAVRSVDVEALQWLRGPARVVAGAGTGKTALLADRFRALVDAGVDQASILVMTFTERASNEMRARIETAVAAEPGTLPIATFHAAAQQWLRQDGWRLGLPSHFRILAGPARWVALRELMWDVADPVLVGTERPDGLVSPLLKLLERLKQELIPTSRLAAWAAQAEDAEKAATMAAAARLFHAYERKCRHESLLDFEDLIAQVVRLLETEPELRRAYAERFRWLLVDEYQDTNFAQERLVELLAETSSNVFVVGDDDQSIYRFRGASRASMERFLARFPTARTLGIGSNHRSGGNIVAAARTLIENNAGRLAKEITARRPAGVPVEIWECPDGEVEAAAIAGEIERLREGGCRLGGIAVLARTNSLLRQVAAALGAHGVPHRVWGAAGLYQQPEVKDVVAWLRVLADEEDAVARARLEASPTLSRALHEAVNMRVLATQLGVRDLLFELLNRTSLMDSIVAADGGRNQAIANVERFVELADEWCEQQRDQSLARFLEHLDLLLLADVDEELPQPDLLSFEPAESVHLMTIHRAKGLEFDAVFVPALVDGRLPQPRRQDRFTPPAELAEPSVRGREDHLGEERRLLYVAMTRARDRLYLSWARRYEGARDWARSRFLEEIEKAPVGTLVNRVVRVEPSSAEADMADITSPPGADKPRLSFSSVSTYRECPRAFRYRYVDRLPAPPSVEAQYGTLVHLVLSEAGRRRRAGEPITPEALEEIERECWAGVELSDPRRAAVLRRLASDHLRRYVEQGGFDAEPALIEEPFELAVENWHLRGVIDRVDAGPPWRILDYKTGTPLPPRSLKRDLQLALYAQGAREALGLEPLELEIVYLRDGSRIAIEPTEEFIANAREVVDGVASRISARDFTPQPERRRCRRCPYRLPCDASL